VGSIDSLLVDVNEGALGTSTALEAADYSANATMNAAARFAPPSSNGAWAEVDLPAASFGAVSSGLVQLRLREDSVKGTTPSMLGLDGAGTPNGPQLIVVYVP
jgi:hypothetical protein